MKQINKIIMKKSFVVILFFLFSLASCAQTNNAIEIPFTLDINRLIVKAKINGKGDYSFIFDTGAQGVILNDSLAKALDLKGEGYSPFGSPNNPNAIQAKNIDIPLFSVNGFESKNEEAVSVEFKKVFPSSKHDGIFGLSVFKGHLVTINYPDSKIIINKGELKENEEGVVKVDLSRILALKGKIDGREIPIHFDSGSPSFITLPMEWKSNLTLKSEPTFFAKGRMASGEVDLYRASLSGKIQVGAVSITDPDIILKTGGIPAANFGYAFLKNYLLTIDMVNHLLKMVPFGNSNVSPNSDKNSGNGNGADCMKYAGDYGNRKVTCEDGQLYSQRIITEKEQTAGGPKIVAPKLKLIADGNDEFKIDQFPTGRIKFVKDGTGKFIEMHVLNPQGEWEKSKRSN
jgi:hypothetical protein